LLAELALSRGDGCWNKKNETEGRARSNSSTIEIARMRPSIRYGSKVVAPNNPAPTR